jgi:hypothetical protein
MYTWVQRGVSSFKASSSSGGTAKSARERESAILKAVPFEIHFR